MFYDLEDPVGFARNVNALLDADGIWVLEMSYMPLMLAMNSFDTICHEHLEYYSLSVLNTIMARAGLAYFPRVAQLDQWRQYPLLCLQGRLLSLRYQRGARPDPPRYK